MLKKKAKKKTTTKKKASKKKTTVKKARAKTAKKKTSTKKKTTKKTSLKKSTTLNKKKKVTKKPISKKATTAKKTPSKTKASYSGEVKTSVAKGKVETGKKVPDFSLSSTAKKSFKLSDFKGSNIILFFYPKDSTPGCTIEGHDFTKLHKKFKQTGTEVFGVSKDSLKSHFKFIEKQKYSVDLLSDETEAVCNLFNVMKEKNMYGRKYFGIERSTFLISKDGKLLKEWRKVKVPGHAQEVLNEVKGL